MTAVTTLRQAGTPADLSDETYREIYDELRNAYSLRLFCAFVRSQYSAALWSKYERGEAPLNRTMRAELRAAVGLPPLPPTVAEALAVLAPDAEVVQVGADAVAHRCIVLATSQPVTLHVNGAVSAEAQNGAPADGKAGATTVTRRHRASYARPCASKAQDARRLALGVSWATVIAAGLAAIEEGRNDR